MAAQIDNTATTTPKGAPLSAIRGKVRHFESVTLTTLGDGHAMPSENAVTRAASTKLPKLMDTLLNGVARCYLLLRADPSASPGTLGDGHAMPSENAVTRAASTKLPKLMDTLFNVFGTKSRPWRK
jgi:hypothetical protein